MPNLHLASLRRPVPVVLAGVLVLSSIAITAITLRAWLAPLAELPEIWQLISWALALTFGSWLAVLAVHAANLPLWARWLLPHASIVALAVALGGEPAIWGVSTLWLAMSLIGAIWLFISLSVTTQAASNVGRRSLAEDVAWVSERIERKALAVAREASQGDAALTTEAQQQRAEAYAALQVAQQMRQALAENTPVSLRSDNGQH